MAISNMIAQLLGRTDTQNALLVPAPNSGLALCEIVDNLPRFLKWERDEQTNGAMAIMEIDASDRVLAALEAQFSHQWTHKTLRKAPPSIRAAMKEFGGLRAKQQAFATMLAEDIVLLGLWWPWGHGGTVSIRLVPYALEDNQPDIEAIRAALMRVLRLR